MFIKKIVSSLAVLSFFGLMLVPAATYAEGKLCGSSATDPTDAGCPGKEICEYNGTSNVCTNVMTGGYGAGESSRFSTALGLNKNRDLKGTIANIINIVLGFLGIVAVIIILAGGFKWMTAGGNEDGVGEAKKMITGGVIGLVVIFAAWAIANFVLSSLQSATSV